MFSENFFPERHCTSMRPAEKERESGMFYLKQEEYTPAPLRSKRWEADPSVHTWGEQPSPERSKGLKNWKQYY